MQDGKPLFADEWRGDFHLQSTAGRWSPAEGTWVVDRADSPCIDAGDPASPFSDEPEPNGGRINLGACGGTEQASKSAGAPQRGTEPKASSKQPEAGKVAGAGRKPASPDVNADGTVDARDLEEVRSRLNRNVDEADNAKYDINGDGKINVLDLIGIRNRMQKPAGQQ